MIRQLVGDSRKQLRLLPAESVQAVITSPPYYGLRDYGTDPLVWGGDPEHVHEWTDVSRYNGGGQPSEKQRWQHTGTGPSGHPKATTGQCPCGAWLGSLGLEPTPDCGRSSVGSNEMVLRNDLSVEERAYVIAELLRLGVVR